MTGIQDLSNELLVEVLQYIEKTELIKCIQVHENWHYLIDRAMGVHMFVGNGTDIWDGEDDDRPTFESIERIREIGIVDCVLSEVVSDYVPTFLRCYLVKQLWFDGYISPKNFNALVAPLINLRDLTIHITTLNTILPVRGTWVTDFPKLKTFMISQANMDGDDLQAMENLPGLLDNIATFLQQIYYPRLEDLSLHLPYATTLEGAMVGAVVNIIARHKRTLKKLTVSFEVRCHLPGQVPLIPFDNKALTGLQLTRYFAHCIQPQRPIMTVFDRILTSQQELQKLHITTGYVPFPTAVVRKNAHFLVAIEISLSAPVPPVPPIDLSILGTCKSLKLLSLFGKVKEQDIDNNGDLTPSSSNPDIIGLNRLQPSVESIRICNLFMPTSNTQHIATNLTKLQILELKGIGMNGDLGLDVETIVGVMERKVIQSFTCASSFNFDSLENALQKPGDRITNFTACTMSFLRNSSFIINLDEGNVYRPADSPKSIIVDVDLNVSFPVEDILNVFQEEDNGDDDEEDNEGNGDEDNGDDDEEDNDGNGDEDNGDDDEEDNDGNGDEDNGDDDADNDWNGDEDNDNDDHDIEDHLVQIEDIDVETNKSVPVDENGDIFYDSVQGDEELEDSNPEIVEPLSSLPRNCEGTVPQMNESEDNASSS